MIRTCYRQRNHSIARCVPVVVRSGKNCGLESVMMKACGGRQRCDEQNDKNVSVFSLLHVTYSAEKNKRYGSVGRNPPDHLSKENQVGQMFLYFFHAKRVPQASWRHQPPSFIIMASQCNMGPRAPIFEYVGHQHVPQAWRPPMCAAQARYGFYCHRNTRYVEIR